MSSSTNEPWILGASERRTPSVRAQTAVVRALADALKAAGGIEANSLREQLIEELARLGLKPSEAALQGR